MAEMRLEEWKAIRLLMNHFEMLKTIHFDIVEA